MGFIRKEFGRFCIETRRESFIIHYPDEHPHPEFMYYDMPDLIAALMDAAGAESVAIAEQRLTPDTGEPSAQGPDEK